MRVRPDPFAIRNMLRAGYGVEDIKVQFGLSWARVAREIAALKDPRWSAHLRIASRRATEVNRLPRVRAQA